MIVAATLGKRIISSAWFWIVVVVLLAIWLLGPRIKNAIRTVRTPDRGNYAGQSAPNAADRARLESLARKMREEIVGIIGWDEREETAGQILAVNDTELKYLAEFYRTIGDGDKLSDDIEREWSWIGSNKQQLIARLRAIKE